jgi:heme exporter protein A
MGEEFLTCKGISYTIGYKNLFRNLTFTLFKGEVVLLSGENGSGKTTLLKLIFKEHRSDKFIWNGSFKFPVSYLGHEPGIYTSLSLQENLDYFAGITAGSISHLLPLLEEFKLHKRLLDPVNTFSEGMKRKAGILRALLPNSPLLLLDEPFNGLDKNSVEVLKRILIDYSKDKTVLLATHDPDVIKSIFKREFHLSEGGMACK